MGRKAKKRSERKEDEFGTWTESHPGEDMGNQIRELMADRDAEMIFMDRHLPVYAFINKKTQALSVIGEPLAVRGFQANWRSAMEESREEGMEEELTG